MPAGAPVEGPVGYAAVALAATPAHIPWSDLRAILDLGVGALQRGCVGLLKTRGIRKQLLILQGSNSTSPLDKE